MPPAVKPTITAIARQAGVSLAAVSYTLNGTGSVSATTRHRVLEIAKQMGYPLKSASINTPPVHVGIMYPATLTEADLHLHEIYSGYARGINNVAAASPRCVATYCPNTDSEALPWQLQEQNLTGMLYFGCDENHPSVQRMLRDNIPVVLLNHHGTRASSVCVANRRAEHFLVEHLITVHGCRRIAFVGVEPMPTYARDRLAGYRDALAAHELPSEAVLIVAPNSESFAGLAQRIAAEVDEFDAVAAMNDITAMHLVRHLRPLGVMAPDHIRLVGFDNIAFAAQAPGLTTIDFDRELLGRRAMELLLSTMQGEIVTDHRQLPYKPVVRTTCGCKPEEGV